MGGCDNATPWNVTSDARPLPVAWVVLLSSASVVGGVGNALIVGAVTLRRRLRVVGDVFAVNLAAADLLVTCYVMPVGLVTSLGVGPPPLVAAACDVSAFVVACACAASLQFTAAVAVERFARICRTSSYRRLFGRHLVVVYVVVSWTYSAALACHGWTGWTRYAYQADAYICTFSPSYSPSYDVFLAVLGLFLPMAVVTFSYVNIFRTVTSSATTLADHRRQSHGVSFVRHRRSRRDVRLTATLLAIVAALVLFWSPAGVVVLLAAGRLAVPRLVYSVVVWLALCNSAANALTYGLLNNNFRSAYLAASRRLLSLRRRQKGERRKSALNKHSLSELSRDISAETEECHGLEAREDCFGTSECRSSENTKKAIVYTDNNRTLASETEV